MIIEIENLRLKGFVGVYEQERANPQDIIINVRLDFNAEKAVQADSIEHAVDYEKLSNDIRVLVEQNSFCLLETLSQKIADIISADPRVLRADVKVSKPCAIPAADNVSVTAQFDRDKKF